MSIKYITEGRVVCYLCNYMYCNKYIKPIFPENVCDDCQTKVQDKVNLFYNTFKIQNIEYNFFERLKFNDLKKMAYRMYINEKKELKRKKKYESKITNILEAEF